MDELSRSYQILGLDPPASEDQIKAAYRDLVKVWHPDRFAHDERMRLKAQDKLKELNAACKFLLANLNAQAATPPPEPSPAPDIPPQESAPPPATEELAATTDNARVAWIALATIMLLLFAATVWAYWQKGHHSGNQASNSTPADSGPATGLRRGLVLDFDFHTKPAAGKIKDLSGHGNDGQAIGVTWVADAHQGGAVSFGPGASSIRVPNNQSLNPPQFTLAVWIKTTQRDPLWHRIVDKGNWENHPDTEQGYDLTMGGNANRKSWQGQALLEVSTHAAVSKADLTDGTWHHVVGTFDGTNLQLFVDGHLTFTNRVTQPLELTPFDLTIGNICPGPVHGSDTTGFTGLMDDLMLYDRVLSADEVQELFASQGDTAGTF